MNVTWCLVAMVDIAIVIAAVAYTVWSQRRYRERNRFGASRR